MLTETLTFYEPAERMPDSDSTVLVRIVDAAEPLWLGFHDGEQWRDIEGQPVEVVRWSELPLGGCLMQSPSPSSLEQVRQALRRAFQLGQTYWMHADSESLIQHQKADVVQARFDALVEETCAALSAVEALAGQQEPVAVWQSQCKDGAWADCTEANARAAETYGFKARKLYASPAALQQQEAGSQWRDIESAPKDGREVILSNGSRVGAACWVHWPDTHDSDGALDHEGGEGWTVGMDGDEWTAPTHWQPLPPPPGACAPSPTEPADGVPGTDGGKTHG